MSLAIPVPRTSCHGQEPCREPAYSGKVRANNAARPVPAHGPLHATCHVTPRTPAGIVPVTIWHRQEVCHAVVAPLAFLSWHECCRAAGTDLAGVSLSSVDALSFRYRGRSSGMTSLWQGVHTYMWVWDRLSHYPISKYAKPGGELRIYRWPPPCITDARRQVTVSPTKANQGDQVSNEKHVSTDRSSTPTLTVPLAGIERLRAAVAKVKADIARNGGAK